MDEPVRPLIRFTTAAGEVFVEPMNGAILGSAEWLGRIPDHTVEVAISPSRRIGPFNFRIDSITGESTAKLLLRGILRSKLWTYWTLRCLAVGSRREAWQALKSATEGTRFEDYAAWYSKNARTPDFLGFDASRCDHAEGPRFIVVIAAGDGSPAALQRTLQSLTEQSYRRYAVGLLVAEPPPQETKTAFHGFTADSGDFARIFGDADWATLRASLAANDWIVTMNAGDRLRPHALALVAEKLAETSELDAIYTDEDSVTPEGAFHSPALKPDWSPIYQTQARYVERALFIRADVISQDVWLAGLSSTNFMSDALNAINAENIHHLRRMLYCRERATAVKRKPAAKNAGRQPATAAVQWPAVSVIIPTKDRVNLLATCLEGIERKTDYPNLNIVIVDNGSTAPETLKFLENLHTNEKIRVVRSPGRFNFSKLCNVGAAASESPILLFLNNDIEIRSSAEWLQALVRWAVLPQIGAVGAKLFFANGRIQHAGVVLGLSGIAGHAYLHQVDIGNGDGRWFDVTHEISAVTGACLAVEREKFDAAGGFDEKLAVDLNDIDLCLRLAAHGWTNVWTPDAKLIHRESSSRGLAKNYFEAYSREIGYFNDRWTHVIRDDPYFHPGLSLYAHDIMLA